MFENELVKNMLEARIPLPALEVAALVGLLAICLVFRLPRVGIVSAYIFVYRWGWLFFTEQTDTQLAAYLVFGSIIAILTVVNMFRSNPEHE